MMGNNYLALRDHSNDSENVMAVWRLSKFCQQNLGASPSDDWQNLGTPPPPVMFSDLSLSLTSPPILPPPLNMLNGSNYWGGGWQLMAAFHAWLPCVQGYTHDDAVSWHLLTILTVPACNWCRQTNKNVNADLSKDTFLISHCHGMPSLFR